MSTTESERTLIASRRVVIAAADGSHQIVPACIELSPPTIKALHRLDAGAYDASLAEVAAGADATDHGDKLIAPAFVNAHTHLALGFLRGFDLRAAARGNMVEDLFFAVEAKLSPADIRAFAVMGAYDSLSSGVGLVWDHYYAGEQIAAALEQVGLSGVVAPTLQDLSGPGTDAWQAQLQATADIDDSGALRQAGIFAAVGPHATDTVSERLFGAALDLAEARNLPLHAHAAQSLEELERAHQRHGLSPIGWLQRIGVLERAPAALFAHCIYASKGDLCAFVSTRSTLVWCPYSALVFGFPARPGLWSELGLDWAVGTDCASSNDTMNVQQELRHVAAQRTVGSSWSPSYDALLAADDDSTSILQSARAAWQQRKDTFAQHEPLATPAALLERVWSRPGAMHPAFRAGVLEPGALANILVFDLEHPALWPALDPLHCLTMSDATRAIWAMYVAGRPIGTAGDFQASLLRSEAYTEARIEADARLASILDEL